MAVDFKFFQRLPWYYQALAVAGICGLLLAGVWYIYLTPIQEDVAQKTKNMAELTKQIADAEAKLKEFAKLKREADALQAEIDQLKTALPLEKETHQILDDIQELVAASGLKIRHVGPRATIDRDFYTEWPWDIEVVGTFHNIGLFLDRVRKLNRIVSVSNLKISGRASSGPESRTGSVAASYTATTYVYREEQPPAPPPAKK